MKVKHKGMTKESAHIPTGVPALPGWWPYPAVVLTVFLLYARTLSFGYTYMDDYGLVVENYRFLGDIRNLYKAFSLDVFGIRYGSMYRPVFTVSLMLDAWWAGIKPWAYHLTNIAIHAANGCLFYHLLILLGRSKKEALFVALVFAVHPALATAVAWIGGRNDSLMTFWVLISFILLVRYRLQKKNIFAAFSLAAWSMAVFTKEPALLFPVTGGIYLWTQGKRGKQLAVMTGGWVITGILFLIARWNVARPGQGAEIILPNTPAQNLNGLLSYLTKVFLPVRLSVYAGYDPTFFWLGIMVLAVLVIIVWRAGIRDKGMFLLGGAWFLAYLVPYAWRGVDYPNFLEHRLYLPVIGLAVMLLAIGPIVELKATAKWVIGATTVVLLSVTTAARMPIFANGLSFWSSAVEYSPGLYCVHDMLGKIYYERGEMEKAGQQFRRTLELKNDYPFSLNNLGMVFLQLGLTDSAVSYFKKAVHHKPDYAEAWANLGSVYLQSGDRSGAEMSFMQSYRADTLNATACNGLGMISSGKDSFAQAEDWYQRSVKLDPLNCGAAWFNLGTLYARSGKLDKALESLKEAVRLDPVNAAAHRELGIIYLRLKDLTGAAKELKRSLELEPNDPATNNYLALVSFGMKDYGRASLFYQRAVELGLKPDPRVWRMIAQSQKGSLTVPE